jgi:predicted TIM-barrel fold metal-dependent hydrolase
MPYERLLREWDELGYSDEIKERIFYRNAERVLNLPKSSVANRAAASSRKEAD